MTDNKTLEHVSNAYALVTAQLSVEHAHLYQIRRDKANPYIAFRPEVLEAQELTVTRLAKAAHDLFQIIQGTNYERLTD